MKKQIPKLKIVARGSEVKVLGDERELIIFEEKFKHLTDHIEKFENLNITDLERILGAKVDTSAPADGATDKFASGEVIVLVLTVLWLRRVLPTNVKWLTV